MDWKGKRVAILGWGTDTQDVAPWLQEQGAKVTILDEKQDNKPFGDLTGYEVLLRSPGVYRYRPEIVEAEKRGVHVTSKTKIFFDVCPGQIIGVTGTKGKGTTSTLIFEILKAAGSDVYLGGNIGMGMFGFLPALTPESLVVLELSSFQLMDLEKSPHIAVVLMTTTDHLDWHISAKEYVKAKSAITKFQDTNDWVVVNKDYVNSVKIGKMGRGQKIWVSGKDFGGKTRLRGNHNKENIAAALAVARILEVGQSTAQAVVAGFTGLVHRLEEVAVVGGVTYYDDSFSTTPETTMAAIKAFEEPVVLIAGGSDKGSDFSLMGKTIAESENIKAVVLIGQMAGSIKEAILKGKGKRDIKLIEGCRNMTEIVKAAAGEAKPGDVVVLSPACASFDMFANYKERGDLFKKEVLKRV